MHAIPETGNDQHTTQVSIAALVVNPLESYGLDYRSSLEEAGIDAHRIYAPYERVCRHGQMMRQSNSYA